MKHFWRTALLVALGGLLPASDAWSARETVRIGVVAGGDAAPIERWTPTADYLERLLPQYDFAFSALTEDELRERLSGSALEFALTDPGLYVQLAYAYDLAAVATRRAPTVAGPQAHLAAAIVVRANRDDIVRLADLEGRSLAAVHAPFGSFHLAWRELQRAGIHPFRDLTQIALERVPAAALLRDLLRGAVDAVALPADTLDRLQRKGVVAPDALRLLEPQPATPEFPFPRTTPLYPEWALAAAAHAPSTLVDAVRDALLAMPADHPAARAGGYAGWAPAVSYEPVVELFRDLRLGPYRDNPILAHARDNWFLLLFAVLALVALIAVAIEMLHMNRRVAEAMRGGRRAREQMQLFASAVEQTADAVMITDPRGVIEYVNPAFTRVTGYAPEEVHGRTPAILKSGQHDVRFYQRLWDTITRGEVYRDEIINRRKDGTLYIEQKSIMALRDANGRISHFVAAGRDITEQRRAEEEAHLRRDQLAHTARVNIIGEMAASIAHEISQPLTAIINYAQGSTRRLRSGKAEPERLLGVFEQIVAQAQRVADAVVMLRRFVARRKAQRVAADVNALIRQVVALANSETRGRGISIVLELAENLPPALVDDVQIEQVVLNLLRNGAEALASADAPQRELRVRTARADDGSIEVAISDSGPGLPPQLAAKLFEPFFTTKPDGVGLGLAISRSIIENHGGRIWVTPNPERGVTFRFTIPVETQTHEQ